MAQIHDIHIFLHHETDKAILVSVNGEKVDAVWIPKSWLECEPEETNTPGQRIISLKDYHAVEKGLV